MDCLTDLVTFAKTLQKTLKKGKLHVSLPLSGMSFGSDNYKFFFQAFMQMEGNQPILIRQFTDFQSDVPFGKDPSRFLPIKRIAAFFLDEHGRVFSVSKEETRNAFSTDANTGAPIEVSKDLVFVDAKEMWDRLIEFTD